MDNYEKQAEDFLKKTNTTLKITIKDYGKYFDDDKQSRNIYICTLKRNNKKYSFTFGDSIYNTEKNIKPSPYSILSCIEKYDPESFENFCNNYGYSTDSRKAEKIYKAVKRQYEKIYSMFSDCMNELQKIQ